MRAEVNSTLCCGYQVCVEIAPTVYQVNLRGKAETMFDIVPEDLRDQARRGARECPAGAIALYDDIL